MKNTLDVSDYLFKALNVTGVKATITGSIYKNRRPTAKALAEDIVIQPIVMANVPVNETAVNINMYFADLSNGTPDETRMKACINAVYTALDSYAPTTYFAYDFISENIIGDELNIKWSFVNLRINVFTH